MESNKNRHIRARVTNDNVTLLDIWHRSVKATHLFLTELQIEELYPLVRDCYLDAMPVWVLEDTANTVIAFIGMDEHRVEMLFVDPDYRGSGAGTQLLDFARTQYDTIEVDVNEQNPQALGFYTHYGFTPIGRSEHDSDGRPFPLIHMRFSRSK